jgi:polar amino acid transport system permease protein
MANWETDWSRDALKRIVMLLFALANLADLAAGAHYRRRRQVLGIRLSSNPAAVVALVVNVSAYGIEIIRAGIESIGKGQIEAGRALGLKPLQIFRLIVLKPAIQAIYPSLTSQFILLLLNSSVCSAIAATELTAAAGDIQSRTFRSFEVYFVITCIYFVMSLFFWGVFGAIERTWLRKPARR